ncbi:MAG: twin-arginine translocase subunit TatC [Nitrospinae bacterium]|nr:twin-arginine translocase subunit TatC [Nitrospinota bacterium]MBI3814238.1 twin-arginine translocase subunit TatC [Nitrospinota bacterium]
MRKVAPEEKLPFTEHLEEFRWRLIIVIATVAVWFGICYNYSADIIRFVQKPLNQKLIFISPTEAFFVNMKVAFFAALFLSLPVIIYQLWAFVAPGLLEREKKYTLPFIISATLCFLTGAGFCYFIVLPVGTKFLLSFAGSELKPMISINNYISFISRFMIAFGAVFEFPVVIFFLSKVGIVTPEILSKNRRYSILGIFVLSAILSPPDVFSMFLMAIPLMGLYEISIIISRVFGKKAAKGKVVEGLSGQGVEETLEPLNP